MALNLLPNELLVNISQRIDSPRDLVSLSICSHRMKNLAQPILYSSIKQTSEYTLSLLIRTFLDNPQLAGFVKVLSAYWVRRVVGFGRNSQTVILLDSHHTQLEHLYGDNCLQGVVLGSTATHARDLINGSWNMAAACLLLLLPNIEALNLSNYGYEKNNSIFDRPVILERVLLNAGIRQDAGETSPHSLSKLQNVSIEIGATLKNDLSADSMTPFMKLKSVKTFSCCGLRSYHLRGSELAMRENVFNANTESISFIGSCLSEVGFFLNFSNLRRFEYHHKSDPYDDLFRPCDLLAALAKASHCLEELIIHNLDESQPRLRPVGGSIISATRPIESFAGFGRLKWIEASPAMLLGFQNGYNAELHDRFYTNEQHQTFLKSLPCAIETLVLRNCSHEPTVRLLHVLLQGRRDGYIQNLRTLTLWICYKAGEIFFTSFEPMAEEALKLGIVLEYDSIPRDRKPIPVLR